MAATDEPADSALAELDDLVAMNTAAAEVDVARVAALIYTDFSAACEELQVIRTDSGSRGYTAWFAMSVLGRVTSVAIQAADDPQLDRLLSGIGRFTVVANKLTRSGDLSTERTRSPHER